MKIAALLICLLSLIIACQPTDLKKKQFTSFGKLVYQKQCANCHQTDGNGYQALYPPLNGSDILMKNPMEQLNTIVHGSPGGMEVNGKKYSMSMPKFDHLTHDELAKVLTFITNSWENSSRLYTAEEVADWLKTNPKYLQEKTLNFYSNAQNGFMLH